MNRTKSLIALLCCFLFLTGFTPALAERNNDKIVYYNSKTISASMEELDPFIIVKDNQYHLELPKNVKLDSNLQKQVNKQLEISNALVRETDLTINPQTKVAYPSNLGVQPMAYGYNAVYVHWNYLEIYMDAGLVRDITSVSVAVAIGILFVKLPALVAFGVAHPYLAITISAIAAQIISSVINSGIRDGLVLHYNFFTFQVTYVGRQ